MKRRQPQRIIPSRAQLAVHRPPRRLCHWPRRRAHMFRRHLKHPCNLFPHLIPRLPRRPAHMNYTPFAPRQQSSDRLRNIITQRRMPHLYVVQFNFLSTPQPRQHLQHKCIVIRLTVPVLQRHAHNYPLSGLSCRQFSFCLCMTIHTHRAYRCILRIRRRAPIKHIIRRSVHQTRPLPPAPLRQLRRTFYMQPPRILRPPLTFIRVTQRRRMNNHIRPHARQQILHRPFVSKIT